MENTKSLYPLEVNFRNQAAKQLFDNIMSIKPKIRKRKKYFWFIAERNLLASLIFACGTDVGQIQKELKNDLQVFKTLPANHPAMNYYNRIKNYPMRVKQNIINGLIIRLWHVKYRLSVHSIFDSTENRPGEIKGIPAYANQKLAHILVD